MKNKKELKGYWRLPVEDEEDKKDWAGGIATYDPDTGIKLELFSDISGEFLTNETPEFNRIYGKTTEGEKVTLKDCIRAGFSSKANTEKYVARTLFIGDHLKEPEISFDYCRVTYPLLYQWANQTGITRKLAENRLTVDYTPPSAKEAEAEDKLIRILTLGNSSMSNNGEFTIEENTYIETKPRNGELSFSEVKKQASKWKDFLTLATDENIGIDEVTAYQEAESKRDNEVEIYYTTSGDSTYPERLNPYSANFVLDDIEENFPKILTNWMELSNQYQSIYDLYFSVVYQSQMYLDNQYMMLMTALNMVYEQRFNHQYLNQNELQKIITEIEQALPEEVNQEFRYHLLEEMIPAANQYSIKKVLSAIVERYEPVIKELPWDFEEEIAKIAADHDYTAGRSHRLQEIDPQEVYSRTVVLRTLLEAILLTDIGISEDHVQKKLTQNYGPPQSVQSE